jgi:hypothetical protein
MSEMKPKPVNANEHMVRDFMRGFQTKNVVKGAGGGALGVDYQDADAEFMERLKNAAGVKAKGGASGGGAEGERPPPAVNSGMTQQVEQQIRNDLLMAEIAAHNLNISATTVQHTQQALQHKDDEKKKRKPTAENPTDDPENPEDQAEAESAGADVDVLAIPNDEAHQRLILDNIAKILRDPGAERRVFGALALTEPEHMRKTLGTPVRVAKHLLVLAGRMIEKGHERTAVVEYLAGVFLALGGDFGRRAYKDFAGGIGIGAVYPLEVAEKLIALDDKFLPILKCRFTSGKRWLQGKVKEALPIEYPEDLIITGFALKGGGKPGYQLVPRKEKGKHGLRVFEAGEFKLLLMGVDPMGFERLEELKVTITGQPTASPPAGAAPARPPLQNPRFRLNKG